MARIIIIKQSLCVLAFGLCEVLLAWWLKPQLQCFGRGWLAHYFEVFAGEKAAYQAWKDDGWNCVAYDKKYSRGMDFLSPAGFVQLAKP